MIQRHIWPEFNAILNKVFKSPWQPLILLLKINTCLISWLKSPCVCVIFCRLFQEQVSSSQSQLPSFKKLTFWYVEPVCRLKNMMSDWYPNQKKTRCKNQRHWHCLWLLWRLCWLSSPSSLTYIYIMLNYCQFSSWLSRCCLDFACLSILVLYGWCCWFPLIL